MPFDPVPTHAPGGYVVMEYTIGGDFNEHTIRLNIAPFNPTPTEGGDFLYTGAAPKTTVTEAGVKETALALASLWSLYYPATAQIIWKELCYNSGGQMTNVPLPTASTIGIVRGTYIGDAAPVRQRVFDFFSSQNIPGNHLYLMQHPASLVNVRRALTATEGGFDARDIAVAAYLTSPNSGIVGRDGYPLKGAGVVSIWWSHSLVMGTAGGAGAGMVIVAPTEPEGLSVDALWIDTSGGTEPYPLRAYSAALGAWVDVTSGTVIPG